MDCVVAPVLHTLLVNELEVSVTLSPWHNVVGPPAEIVGTAGNGLTVTTKGEDVPVQLLALVVVTV